VSKTFLKARRNQRLSRFYFQHETETEIARQRDHVKSIGAIFPTACAHFVSLCHILVILAIFQTFHYYYYYIYTPILKEVLLWVKWHQTASHATEKSFVKRRVNWFSKIHCFFLILRNCHSHPNPRTHHPDQSAAINIEARPSISKKITTRWNLIWFFLWGGTKSLGTAATCGLFYKPQMIDEGDCGAIGGIKSGRGNRSTRRKPAPAPLCQPKIPHDQTRARTQAAAVGSQRLTAWAMARPTSHDG
jgi:hypothetical protein